MADSLKVLNYALGKELPIIFWSEAVSEALDLANQGCLERPGWSVESRDKLEPASLPASGSGLLLFFNMEFLPFQKQNDIWLLAIERQLHDYKLPADYRVGFIIRPSAVQFKIPNAIYTKAVSIEIPRPQVGLRKNVKREGALHPLFDTWRERA
jgi:hypothetical protein